MEKPRFADHHGSFWLIGDGRLAQLSFQSLGDVQAFNRRYAAAANATEQAQAIRSIIRCVVATR